MTVSYIDDFDPDDNSLFDSPKIPTRIMRKCTIAPKKDQSVDSIHSSATFADDSDFLITSQKSQKIVFDGSEKPILPSLSAQNMRRDYRGEVSILEFDPSNPKMINEALSKKAMDNLGVKFKDLCYPTMSDLLKYSKDESMAPLVRERLEIRANQAIESVKNERTRLINNEKAMQYSSSLRQSGTISRSSRSVPSGSAGYACERDCVDGERSKLKHYEKMNKKKTEDIFFAMYIGHLNELKKSEASIKKEKEEKSYQEYVAEKRKQEEEQKARKANERERIVNEQIAKRESVLQSENERYIQFEKRRQAELEKQKKMHEEIEKNRLEHVKKVEKRNEEERKRKAEKILANSEDREKYEEMMKSAKQREISQIRKRNQESQAKAKENIAIARSRYEKSLEDKRKATNERLVKQETCYQRIMEMKRKELEKQRVENEKKVLVKKQAIKAKEERLQTLKEEFLKEKEEKTTNALKQREADKERVAQERVLLEQMKTEDNQLAYERRAKLREAIIQENEEKYNSKMERLKAQEEHKQKVEQQNKLARAELEREKERIITANGLGNVSSFIGRSESEIQMIANRVGVDFEKVKERADKLMKVRK